jgi:glycerol transport system ATP-binding protein
MAGWPPRPPSPRRREGDPMALITLDNVAHSYSPRPRGPEDFAVKQLDHVWEDGGAYALLGPSGCGKTTLLNIISGLIVPTQGSVRFGLEDVTRMSTERRNIAQVFQFPVIYDTMTVYKNLAFPLANRGVPADRIDARVREVAAMLELTDSLERKARRLTADAKQKISLGRALVRSDVAAILFDEPLTVMDPRLKWQLRSQLKKLHRDFDFTMIYVTHDQTEALTFADTVVVMYEGEVVQIGTPEELFERPAHTFVGYFIGSPGMNIAKAEVSGNKAVVAGHVIELDRAYPALEGRAKVEIGVRPEFVALTTGDDGLPVTIQRVDDLGRVKVIMARLGEHTLNIIAEEGTAVPATDARIRFDKSRVQVYADGRIVEGTTLEGRAA